jgi:anti-anti-sigma factor
MTGTAADQLVTVRLVGLPVPVHVRASEHMEALSREFEIIRRSDAATDSVPARLHALIEELDGQFTAFTTQPLDQLRDAIESGDPSIDLEFRVPITAVDAAARLRALLDEADAYCRAGRHLLTLATPPDAAAYRNWFLDEFTYQAGGELARPWSSALVPNDNEEDAVVAFGTNNHDDDQLPDGWSVDQDGATATVRLSGDLDLEVAPTLRELLTRVGDGLASVTVDLSAVSFLDSVGISVLLAAYQRLDRSAVSFALVASPRVLRTLTIAGVADVLGARPAELDA